MSPFEEHTGHDKEICQAIDNFFVMPNTSYFIILNHDRINSVFMAKDN